MRPAELLIQPELRGSKLDMSESGSPDSRIMAYLSLKAPFNTSKHCITPSAVPPLAVIAPATVCRFPLI